MPKDPLAAGAPGVAPDRPAAGRQPRAVPAHVPGASADIVADSAGFDALEHEWSELAARAPGAHYFHDYRWCRRIWQCIAQPRGRALRIVVVRERGRLVLVWPLMIDGRSLRSLASDSFEYRDLLVDAGERRDAWMDAAWRAVSALDGIDLMLFQNVRAPSNLGRLLARHATSAWTEDKASLVVRLDRFDGWDAYEASLPKRLMSDQRRQWRRLEQAASGTRFDVVEREDDIDATVDFLVDHKLVWLEARALAAANFGTPEYRRFLKSVARDALARGALVLSRLTAGDRLVSAGFALRRGGEVTFLIFAYDFAWENFSPSRLLLERELRWCFEHGVALFDFLPGGDYKQTWTNDEIAATTYMVPTSVRGRAIRRWYVADLAARIERSFVKRLYLRLPERARHAVYRALARRKLVGLGFIRRMRALRTSQPVDFRAR